MNLLRYFVSVGLLGLTLGGCGDDDDGAPIGPAGAGGSGGQSGTGGTGGAAGAGGASGQGGAGGAAGGAEVLRASELASNNGHNCALVEGGKVFCWGSNLLGQFDASKVDRLNPVPVLASPGGAPLTGVKAVAVGSFHTCALVDGGQVRCWGAGSFGALGDGTGESRPTPVPVVQADGAGPLTGVAALALGNAVSCALLEGGEARCWGSNPTGQLGNGTTSFIEFTPVPVVQAPGGEPLKGIQSLHLNGLHACALLAGGEVRCWGANDSGQLGDGTTIDRTTPVPVLQAPGGAPLTNVQAIEVGGEYGCALLAGGEVRCWGDNAYGQLGDGTTTDRATPVPVLQAPGGAPLTGVQSLALGKTHSCALLAGGEARCWGLNVDGGLGDGTTTARPFPGAVLQAPGGPALTGVKAMALGINHTCALMAASGDVRCWGNNEAGAVGDGTTIDRYTPVAVVF